MEIEVTEVIISNKLIYVLKPVGSAMLSLMPRSKTRAMLSRHTSRVQITAATYWSDFGITTTITVGQVKTIIILSPSDSCYITKYVLYIYVPDSKAYLRLRGKTSKEYESVN